MKNLDRIKNMNKEELAGFLDKLIDNGIDKTEPYIWFDKKYCKVCPDIEIKYEGKEETWKKCYFEGNCPHYNNMEEMIKLWLDGEIS